MQVLETYVVMCNDSAEAVVLGTREQAEVKMTELAKADDARYIAMESAPTRPYQVTRHWHLRSVPVFAGDTWATVLAALRAFRPELYLS